MVFDLQNLSKYNLIFALFGWYSSLSIKSAIVMFVMTNARQNKFRRVAIII